MLRRFATALPITFAVLVQAGEVPPAMVSFIDKDLVLWVYDAQIVAAINAQNVLSAGLS